MRLVTLITLLLLMASPTLYSHAQDANQAPGSEEMTPTETPVPKEEAEGPDEITPAGAPPAVTPETEEVTTEVPENIEPELPPPEEEELLTGPTRPGALPPLTPAEEGKTEEEAIFEDELVKGLLPGDKEILGPKKLMIDAIVYVDYQFFSSSDAFKVKYHLDMGGNANVSTALIKGNAEIATEVTGYLAKWPQGQCLLDVNIAKVPYEIAYHQKSEDEVAIKIEFKKGIQEKWESTCTYIDGVTKPFITQGPPEEWVGLALAKTSPPLSSLEAPLEKGGTTSITFDIPEYTVPDGSLGSAKIKGTGVVTIQPLESGQKEETEEKTTPSKSPIDRTPSL